MEKSRLDKLGRYFTYHNIGERYGITFDEFIRKVELDSWADFVGSAPDNKPKVNYDSEKEPV